VRVTAPNHLQEASVSQPSASIIVTVPAELVTAAENTGLTADGVESLKAAFTPHFVRFHEIAESARGVPIDAPKKAREMRLELRAIRTAAEKTRKALKEDSLRRGKAIDGINALLEYQLVPIENEMEKIEKAEETREAARLAGIKAERTAALAPYADPTFYDLAAMPAGQWDMLLSGAKAEHDKRVAAEAKAEADRQAALKAEAEAKAKREAEEAAERERMKAENARLAALAAEERQAREAAEAKALAERVEAERKAKAEKAEADRLLAAEREKSQRALDEAAAALVKKLEAEKAAEEAEAKRVAEAKAAAQKAAAAPDRAKVTALADVIAALPLPTLTSETGKPLGEKIQAQAAQFVKWLRAEAARL
jgi:colicin import membrane protein